MNSMFLTFFGIVAIPLLSLCVVISILKRKWHETDSATHIVALFGIVLLGFADIMLAGITLYGIINNF